MENVIVKTGQRVNWKAWIALLFGCAVMVFIAVAALVVLGSIFLGYFPVNTPTPATPIVIEAPTPAPTFTPTPEPPAVLPQPTYTPAPTPEPCPTVEVCSASETDNMCLVWDDLNPFDYGIIGVGLEYRIRNAQVYLTDVEEATPDMQAEGAYTTYYADAKVTTEDGRNYTLSLVRYTGPFEEGTIYDVRVVLWRFESPTIAVYTVIETVDEWLAPLEEDIRGDTDVSSA